MKPEDLGDNVSTEDVIFINTKDKLKELSDDVSTDKSGQWIQFLESIKEFKLNNKKNNYQFSYSTLKKKNFNPHPFKYKHPKKHKKLTTLKKKIFLI